MKTLADVLREIARKALEDNQAITLPVWKIIAAGGSLSEDELRSIKFNPDFQAQAVKDEKRISTSYITNTCNRMRELQEAGKSVSIKFGKDDESGAKTLTLRIKDGAMKIGSRGKAENLAVKRGIEEFARRILATSPDISHISGDERQLGALDGMKALKEFIKKEAGL